VTIHYVDGAHLGSCTNKSRVVDMM
jgi:hypothetical protein